MSETVIGGTPGRAWTALGRSTGRRYPPRPAVILHPQGEVFALARRLQDEMLRPLVVGVRCSVPWPHLTLASVPRSIGFEGIAAAVEQWAAATGPLTVRAERMTTRVTQQGRVTERTVALTLSDDGAMLRARERLLGLLGVPAGPRRRQNGQALLKGLGRAWNPHVTLLQCGRADGPTWARLEETAEAAEFPMLRETLETVTLRMIDGDTRRERVCRLGPPRTP